jgi:hypothetical protein
MASAELVDGSGEPGVANAIPDYRGADLDVAFADAVRRNLGIPMLVDDRNNRVRVQVLA